MESLNLNITRITPTNTPFQVGDEVFSIIHGHGKVIHISDVNKYYPVAVEINNITQWYTDDGKLWIKDKLPILFKLLEYKIDFVIK